MPTPKGTVTRSPLLDSHLREVRQSLADLQPTGGRYVTVDGSPDLVLANGVVAKLRHELGRSYTTWRVERLRGATATGRFVELSSSGGALVDPTEELWLDVQGHGTSVTVRIWVE